MVLYLVQHETLSENSINYVDLELGGAFYATFILVFLLLFCGILLMFCVIQILKSQESLSMTIIIDSEKTPHAGLEKSMTNTYDDGDTTVPRCTDDITSNYVESKVKHINVTKTDNLISSKMTCLAVTSRSDQNFTSNENTSRYNPFGSPTGRNGNESGSIDIKQDAQNLNTITYQYHGFFNQQLSNSIDKLSLPNPNVNELQLNVDHFDKSDPATFVTARHDQSDSQERFSFDLSSKNSTSLVPIGKVFTLIEPDEKHEVQTISFNLDDGDAMSYCSTCSVSSDPTNGYKYQDINDLKVKEQYIHSMKPSSVLSGVKKFLNRRQKSEFYPAYIKESDFDIPYQDLKPNRKGMSLSLSRFNQAKGRHKKRLSIDNDLYKRRVWRNVAGWPKDQQTDDT